MRSTVLIAVLCLTALSWAGAAQGPAAQPAESGLQIRLVEALRVPHVNVRYQTVKHLPKADYEGWQMSADGLFGETMSELPKDPGAGLLELLLVATNTGQHEVKLEFTKPKLELLTREALMPWEWLFPGIYDGYEDLARVLSLSGKPPEEGSAFVQLSCEGDCYCPLKGGRQTWLALIYPLPRNVKEANLFVGTSNAIPVKIPQPGPSELSAWATNAAALPLLTAREAVTNELRRWLAERARLAARSNELAVLREEVQKMRDELGVQSRLDMIRLGLSGLSSTNSARPAVPPAPAPPAPATNPPVQKP